MKRKRGTGVSSQIFLEALRLARRTRRIERIRDNGRIMVEGNSGTMITTSLLLQKN